MRSGQGHTICMFTWWRRPVLGREGMAGFDPMLRPGPGFDDWIARII